MEDQERLTKALADRYRIEREIGRGGMATVYLARDLRHERDVAVKVLDPDLAQNLGAERFLLEIKTAANLTHPHILPLFDSGEVDGFLFYVMPFIEGESLKERLDREQMLPCDEALQICREIADALSFAHGRDVIHRDVKPANILLEGGHAVLADFGLAKAITPVGDQDLTRAGFSVGTPAYSSPEQALGDGTVDGRSDLYSLGCVLFEMLAGRPPFVGPTMDSVVRQHLALEPSSVTVLRPTSPPAVEDILARVLAKSPADRFRSAGEFVQALDAAISGEWAGGKGPSKGKAGGWWRIALPAVGVLVLVAAGIGWVLRGGDSNPAGTGVGLDQRSIAVLYLDDLSRDGDLQHVADGLTEGLIAELSRVDELDVVSRNATAPYRGTTAPMDSIAEALEVGTLISGSLEPVGDQLRVSVNLVEGISGSPILRRSFDVSATDLLTAQDSVVHEVAWLLRERLGEEIRLRRHQAETTQVEAWALTRRGERELKDVDGMLAGNDLEGALSALGRADSLFALAEGSDPGWAEPVTARGWVAYQESRLASDFVTLEDALERGMGHAERALAMDPIYPRALELRGTVRYLSWFSSLTPDPDEAAALLRGAQEDLEAAVAADRSLATAHSTLSHLYYQVSDLTNALMAARQAYEADAYLEAADAVLWRLFSASLDLGLLPQARNWCNEGSQRFPENPRFWECKILELTFPAVTPDPEEAWRLRERTVELTPEPQRVLQRHRTMIMVAGVLALAAQPDSARSVLLAARAGADVDPNHELPYLEAWARTVLGDYDEAVNLLASYFGGADTGEEGGADWATHWWWDDLRGHEGFQRLVDASG